MSGLNQTVGTSKLPRNFRVVTWDGTPRGPRILDHTPYRLGEVTTMATGLVGALLASAVILFAVVPVSIAALLGYDVRVRVQK